MNDTEELVNDLKEQLEVNTVFSIGGLPVHESVVISWGIMAFWIILSIILVRNLKVENPSRKQIVLEVCISKLYGFFENTIGKAGKEYFPYLMAVTIFIGTSNIIGIFGFKPPTKDLNITIALAIMSIVLIEAAGIRKKGAKGWLVSKTKPVAIITPINFLELLIKPFSLCLRLFGNVLGAFVIMELIKEVVPIVAPMVASLYFDIFDGFIQAYVFVFLTSLYIKESMEDIE